jgi:DNA-binding NarL/FixJ family response regulator
MMEPVRLLVADDHEIVRKGLRSLLEAQPGWQVTAEACDGREAVEKARQIKPDVTVLDISMPALNGLEAARQMIKNDARAKILILTMHESDPLIREVLDAGARGYVLKSDASRDLVTAVNAVRSNKTFFTAKVAQIVLDGYLDKKPKKVDEKTGGEIHSRLTPRQREIVQLLAEGKSSKEVAVALGLSVKTAETHRANIMRRLDCHSVSELVRYAVRNNIIEA